MGDASKFLWTVAGLTFAGIVGYWVASYAIGDLNKRVLDAAQSLGKVQAQTEQLQHDNERLAANLQDLLARNNRIGEDIKSTEGKLSSVLRSDTGKLIGAIQTLNESPDVKHLAERIQSIEADAIKQCRIALEAMWGNCAPKEIGETNKMPAVTSSLTPVKRGWSEWSGWQIASEWDSRPWNCIRARLYCE